MPSSGLSVRVQSGGPAGERSPQQDIATALKRKLESRRAASPGEIQLASRQLTPELDQTLELKRALAIESRKRLLFEVGDGNRRPPDSPRTLTGRARPSE